MVYFSDARFSEVLISEATLFAYLLKERFPLAESLHALGTKLLQTLLRLLDGLLAVEVCLAKEFVGITNQFLLQGLRQEVLVRQRQPFAYDLAACESRSRVAFAHPGVALKALSPHQLRSQSTMADVGFRTKALYAGSIGQEDADVVEHGRLFYKLGVEVQFGMIRNNLQRFSRYRLAMCYEDMTKLVILGIILINNCLIIHLKNHYYSASRSM